MIGIVYKYTSPSGKSYIGQTIHENIRQHRHFKAANNGVETKFYNAVRKYSWESFSYERLYVIDSECFEYIKKLLNYFEKFYIRKYDSYNNGYNMTLGGDGGNGMKHTNEFKQRQSERMKDNNPAFCFTDEWRQNISKAVKGRKMTDVFKEKTSNRMKANNPMKDPLIAQKVAKSNIGKSLSEEQKDKISKSMKGKKCSDETKMKMSVASKQRLRDSKGHFIKMNKTL